MHPLKYIFLILLLMSFGLLYSFSTKSVQQDPSKRLDWESSSQLTWADFEDTPPGYYQRNIAALTCSIIQYRYHCENGNITTSVKAIFQKDKSWVRESAKTNHYLRHEQLHFDITELFARKLRKFLSQRVYKCDEVEELEEIITVFLDEWRDLQKKYDMETHYSLKEGMQENWLGYVGELMEYYEGH